MRKQHQICLKIGGKIQDFSSVLFKLIQWLFFPGSVLCKTLPFLKGAPKSPKWKIIQNAVTRHPLLWGLSWPPGFHKHCFREASRVSYLVCTSVGFCASGAHEMSLTGITYKNWLWCCRLGLKMKSQSLHPSSSIFPFESVHLGCGLERRSIHRASPSASQAESWSSCSMLFYVYYLSELLNPPNISVRQAILLSSVHKWAKFEKNESSIPEKLCLSPHGLHQGHLVFGLISGVG